MTYQPIRGLKKPIILIMTSKFYRLSLAIYGTLISYLSIGSYATVTTGQGALIIGGQSGGSDVATVACYKKSGWSRLDDLQAARRGHRAIINGNKIYVVGGTATQ